MHLYNVRGLERHTKKEKIKIMQQKQLITFPCIKKAIMMKINVIINQILTSPG